MRIASSSSSSTKRSPVSAKTMSVTRPVVAIGRPTQNGQQRRLGAGTDQAGLGHRLDGSESDGVQIDRRHAGQPRLRGQPRHPARVDHADPGEEPHQEQQGERHSQVSVSEDQKLAQRGFHHVIRPNGIIRHGPGRAANFSFVERFAQPCGDVRTKCRAPRSPECPLPRTCPGVTASIGCRTSRPEPGNELAVTTPARRPGNSPEGPLRRTCI